MARGLARVTAALVALAATSALAGATEAQTWGDRCDGSDGYAASFDGRRTFLWRPDWLMARKAHYAGGGQDRAYRSLMSRANAALGHGTYTVVDKLRTPASGDKHDYMSMGPYWWPDRNRPGGLPYVRRDGQVNPERSTIAFDATDMTNFANDVESLALAYYFTGEERYATKAAEMIRVWFLEPETLMNPNLNHGQAVPGRVSGRAEGVIDVFRLVPVVESIGLLAPSPALTEAEHEGLRDWFAEMVQWMATSPIGREERAAENNHGVYYDMLISHFALFAGLDDVARTVADQFRTRRIDAQIEPDGTLPRELARTRSLHYTTWTITAAFDMATLGQCVGVDLWSHRGPDGQSLRAAVDYVAPYAGRTVDWPWPEQDKDETIGLYEALQRAAWAWSEPAYAEGAEAYEAKHANDALNLRLLAYPG